MVKGNVIEASFNTLFRTIYSTVTDSQMITFSKVAILNILVSYRLLNHVIDESREKEYDVYIIKIKGL